jgi:secreted PhoX family phosphatase
VFDRRRFIQTLLVAATAPATHRSLAGSRGSSGFGRLVRDPRQVLDLPESFEYQILCRKGEEMDDGLLVPGEPDGMAAFQGEDGRIVLVCNHENSPRSLHNGPFGSDLERLDRVDSQLIYDFGGGRTPGSGGTTTIVYNPSTRTIEKKFLSLAGTELNCSGGPTPWGSWLSCEECFTDVGSTSEYFQFIQREKKHGYVFEVPANGSGPTTPRPLRDMGRFEHEAAAVDPGSGIVYLTEDRTDSLFYRFIPNEKGKLHLGGRLQALCLVGKPSFDTRNWQSQNRLHAGKWLETCWLDLQDVDSDRNDLRLRGADAGAAIFARGEGLCFTGSEFAITATIGGPDRLGQVFTYRPSPQEGRPDEDTEPGAISLIAESTTRSLLRHADNITMSPWGDLIICEDTANHCGMVGIRPDGQQYALADNAYTNSELAGVCFSPDGSVMFLNIQVRGLMLAITGPWSAANA